MMYNNLRIGGLASGIDTDSIVKQMMQAARIPVDKMYQQKQILEWKQEDYRAINRSLLSFRDKVFDMKLESTYLAKKATSSNEGALEVTATSNATEGVYDIEIKKMAKGANLISQGALAEESKDDGSTKTLAEQFGLSSNISFSLEGKKVDGVFNTSGQIDITPNDTIYTLVSKINEASTNNDLGIKANYDSTNNYFYITSNTTGADQHISIIPTDEATSNFFKDNLKLNGTDADGDGIYEFSDNGQDAEITIAGSTINMSTNSFSFMGMFFNLKEAPSDPTNPINVTVNVTKDVDGVVEKIKSFVEEYNNLISTINDKLNEKRYRDYPPLTDAQKEEMSDREIELWEEKARSGLLNGENLLYDIVYDFRSAMASIVPNLNTDYDNLAAIGIKTANYWEEGKLHIDDAALRKAVEEDMDGIMELFTKSADKSEDKGIALHLYDEVNNAIDSISAKAGREIYNTFDNSYIGKRLRELVEDINTKEQQLIQLENRYYRQFTAMEQAINRMNAQSVWLSQQLGQG
ncbi:MAG: flagellar hook-associated protein 2 [Clostridia bacterium]|nr:flagellar hook-associated protein 2 [Clostridia bacterium]